MHVLVTGGAGFIGSHSVDLLLEKGVRVRILDNFSTGKLSNLQSHDRLEVLNADIRDKPAVEAAFDDITHVLHLAAQVSVPASVAAPLESAAINVSGFLNVIDAARRKGVRRFVYASSSAVYGLPEVLPVQEDMSVFPISPYGLEKKINDDYGSMYRSLYRLSTMGLRYFNVYGPRQDPSSPYSGVISIYMRCVSKNMPITVFGDGLQTRDFIFVEDVARVNVCALEGDTEGICNVATGRTVTLLNLVEAISSVSGAQPKVDFLEKRPGDIRHSAANNMRLQEELGISSFITLEQGLRELWEYGATHSC